MAGILKEQRNFYVFQTQGSFRNEIGEMTESQVYAHVRTRLGNDMSAAEAVLSELEEKGTATVRLISSLGVETTLEIRRLLSTETVYGIGTNVSCGECGRRLFLEGPVKVAIRDGERWVELQCKSPSCAAYQQPQWYAELALEIHGHTRV
jgi:nicotinic acid phosphoribosyltransferase